MKKLFIATSILLSACITNTPEYIEGQTAFCKEESEKLVCRDAEKNMLSGHIVGYSDKDKNKLEFNVQNGLFEGVAKAYDEQGNKIIESIGKDGKLNGIAKYYDKEGKLTKKLLYKDGEIIKSYFYSENGKLVQESEFKDGKVYKKHYYESGKLMQEGEYKDGKLDGVVKDYYENGKLNLEWNYKDGKPDGLVKKYYENGKLMGEVLFKAGKEIPPKKVYFYYENGKLEQLLENENVNSKKLTGIVKDYYENGKLKHEGRYKDDKREGIHRFYDKDGNIKEEVQYKNGEVFDEEKECMERVRYCHNNEYKKGCRTKLSGKVISVSKDGVTLRAENAMGWNWFLYTTKKYARGDKIDGTKYFEYVGTHEYITTEGGLDRLHAYKETNIPVTCW